MKSQYNILVTGCGGDIGQSIGKILKSERLFSSVIGCDIHEHHAGKFIFDHFVKVKPCHFDDYLQELSKVIEKFNIHIVLPASEPELRWLTDNQLINQLLGRILITANLRSMDVGFDKYTTAKFLKENQLPFPETDLISEIISPVLPLIVKSRKSSGSKSLFFVSDQEEFKFLKRKYPDYIVQEVLENENEEYTCGLFRDMREQTRTLVYRRKLMGGFSGFGTVVYDKTIENLLLKIADFLDLRGSINVQLRLSTKGPVVFEINPRFSSTVMFRHMMGFKDVIWCIEDRLGLHVSSYTAPKNGQNFYKGFYEYID
ncbi:MAG: ATP-grasp domain-containing protein [Bacteroidia bacterium]